MNKLFFSIALAALSVFGVSAQDAPAFIGESEPGVVDIRGSSWLGDWTSVGWSVGSYTAQRNKTVNYLVLYNYSRINMQVAPGSKLVLKVNGQPMVLTTEAGTYYEGSTVVTPRFFDLQGWVDFYSNYVYYEVSQEQADLINQYGFTKYRYQTDAEVYERDGMNNEKIAKKLARAYNRVSSKQSDYIKKVDDLSDF